ncbi:tyrosinase family protein [Aspergillus clavatus NRRL 1]|uniref:Tyrosinase, putative n=1 Tax=Aspergillus clavatus (strain ATCC 1007 / CBS 513.65 / DSM 816 / NCTC 3887 / NRRL 1 / QM 1276 / 107) TaxID=344612 RepID=A1CCY9_ASPCL|nr:tyrosinase, putative [Aspergillus clavatus NRRL 1]EAW12396.1 tyrosinase, putative [Aspergillus clavatus NRRL 1]
MRLSIFSAVTALAAVTPTLGFNIDQWDLLAGKALVNQVVYHYTNPEASKTCTPLTAAIRREWGSLTRAERKEYINAVKCLASKPSKSDPAFAPGARNRYDDFVAVHINQTWVIHATGNFLTWHRYFTWAYEQALRNECGYTGYQPYWAWNKYADDPLNSPIFDGSEYSMSGDGAYIPHEGTEAAPGIVLKPGNGGGCVKAGPFKDWKVNLGPVFPSLKVPGVVAQNGSGLGYNPRCLRRDISKDAARWTTTNYVVDLITKENNILDFQNTMQGDFPNGFLGVHSGGHYTIGGDPGGDFFASPGDPAFFLHHSAIDRAFWTWQNQDPAKRTYVVEGPTVLPGLTPDPPNSTLNDIVDMSSALAPPKKIKELLDTTGGPFCYVYL